MWGKEEREEVLYLYLCLTRAARTIEKVFGLNDVTIKIVCIV